MCCHVHLKKAFPTERHLPLILRHLETHPETNSGSTNHSNSTMDLRRALNQLWPSQAPWLWMCWHACYVVGTLQNLNMIASFYNLGYPWLYSITKPMSWHWISSVFTLHEYYDRMRCLENSKNCTTHVILYRYELTVWNRMLSFNMQKQPSRAHANETAMSQNNS